MRTPEENGKTLAWLAAGALLLASSLPVTVPAAGNSDQWEYEAMIYLWAASIDATTPTGGDIDMSFHDILDDLDMTFMGTFGARKGKWSLLADAVYMDLSQDDSGSETIPVLGGAADLTATVKTDIGMKAWIVSLGAGYNVVDNEKTRLDLLGGARYFDLDVDVKLNLNRDGPLIQTSREVKGSDSDHIWDGIVGLRGTYNIDKNWYLPYYADIGTGGSDLTWQALAGVGYQFKWGDVLLAYRYLDYNFKSDFLLEDMTVKGPALGVRFNF
jgi:hypothetical protein